MEMLGIGFTTEIEPILGLNCIPPPFLHLPCDAVHVLEIVVSYKTVPFGNKEFSYDTIYKDLSYYTVWVPLGFTKKA